MFREVADEIVCCTNSAPEEFVYDALGEVADRIVHYEWQPEFSLDQVLPWAYQQCSREWIFVVHNDEVPSRALLEALPGLRSEELFGHVTTRRWLFGDDAHWLNEYPWEPDFQLRMLRNDRASLHFQRRTIHGGSLPTVPYRRHIDLPLYHLDNLVNDLDFRTAKIASLDAFAPSIPLFDGRSISDVYYQPERFSSRVPAPVPEHDVLAIREVFKREAERGLARSEHRLDRTERRIDRRRAELTTASADEIMRCWPGRPIGESGYCAEVRVTDSPLSAERDLAQFTTRETRLIVVEIVNIGDETWDCDLRGAELYLASRWIREPPSSTEPAPSAMEGERVPLPSYVHPGERDLLLLPVRAPGRSGRYVLDIDLLHEHVRWFGRGARFDVVVHEPTEGAASENAAVPRRQDDT
ncbi:MAG: hypothetical protein JWO62_280 [Acidimicrobiaceae bacterium]|nr:hypothetical protein [Acidimicrobiaceae bacterium]